MRLPGNYLIILDAIRALEPTRHVSAQDIFVRARAAQPKLGFATVHRGLIRLHELGHVVKVDLPGAAAAMYELPGSPHAHFRCVECGGMHDIDYTEPGAQIAAVAERLGLQIAVELTTFAGRCADCARTAGARLNLSARGATNHTMVERRATDEDEVERALLARIADKDKLAFELFYGRYARRVPAFVRDIVIAPDIAEEVASDTLTAVWNAADRYAGRSRVIT